MADPVQDLLAALAPLCGVTGHEEAVTRQVAAAWRPLAQEVWLDPLGTCIAHRPGPGPRVLAAAHADTVGLLVSAIEPGGFLRVVPVGAVDRRCLPGLEVVVHGRRPVPGVIGSRPPHHTRAEERRQLPGFADLYIDTGLPEAEVRALVAPGDPVTWRVGLIPLQNGRVAGPGLDNRAGLAALTAALAELARSGHAADFYAAATVGEEGGSSAGAAAAARRLAPQVVIAVDVTYGAHPGAEEDHFPLDGGPTVLVGPEAHPELARFLCRVAAEAGIPCTLELAPEDSGTDAWAMQVAGGGAVAAVISVPLRYMHTPVEVVSLADVRQAGRLLALAVARLDEGMVARWTSHS